MAEEKSFLGKIFGWWWDDKEQETATAATWAGAVSGIQKTTPILAKKVEKEEDEEEFQSYEDWKKNPKQISAAAKKIYEEKSKQDDVSFYEKLKNIWAPKNEDIYLMEWGKVVVDESWEPIKKKNWGLWLARKYSAAPIKTLFTGIWSADKYLKESAEKRMEDTDPNWSEEQKKIREYKAQKEAEETAKSPDVLLNTNKDMFMDETWDLVIQEDLTVAKKNYDSITVPYLKTETTLQDIENQITELEKKKRETTDVTELAQIETQMDEAYARKILEIVRYTQGDDIANKAEAKTTKDILNNLRVALNVPTASDEYLLSVFSKSMDKKYNEALSNAKTLEEINVKYNIRSDDNAVTLTPKWIIRTFNDKWVIITEEEQNSMFPERQWMQKMLTDVKLDPEKKQQAKYKFHIVNEIQENSFNTLTKWTADYEDSKSFFMQMSQSPESKNLINTILTDPKIDSFYDKEWNFDKKWFFDYASSTKEWNEYYMLLDKITAQKNSDKKWKDAEESQTIIGWDIKKISAWFNDTFLRADDERYDAYKTWKMNIAQKIAFKSMGLDLDNEEIVKWLAYGRWTQSAKELRKDVELWIKREDMQYAQDPWQRAKDSVETLYHMANGNLFETATVITASALPFLDVAKWVEWTIAWTKFIKSLQNPMLRTAFKVWASIAWETAEWFVMWTMLDSMWETQAQPSWMLLDMGIWALKWVNIIREWIEATKLKNEVNAMSKWLDLTNEQDISKLNNDFFKEWYWTILWQEWVKISDFIKDGKVAYSDLYTTLDRWRIKLWLTTNPSEEIYKGMLKNEVDEWKITQNGIDQLYEKASIKYWDSFEDILKNYSNKWVIDKTAVVSRFLADTFSSAEKLAKVKWLQWLSDVMKATGITKPIEDQYNKLTEIINNAKKWASKEDISLLNEQQWIINEMRSEALLTAYRFSTNSGPESFANLTKKMNEVNAKLAKSNIPELRVSTDIKDIYELPEEITKNINDPKKIADIVFWDEEKYHKYWIRIYDVPTYVENNKKHLVKQLWAKWYKRLENIVNMVNDLNGWKLKLLDIPKTIRSTMAWITWFTTFVKEGDSTNMVIWSLWGLIEIVSGWTKIANAENVKYIKTMCHELWHNIMLSLKDNVRKSLFTYVAKFFWKWAISSEKELRKTLRQMLPDISKKRLDFLSKNIKKQWFFDEVSADIMSDAIQSSIFWAKWAVEDIWEAMVKQVQLWNVPVAITKSSSPFNVIGRTVISAIESLYKWTKTTRDPKDLKWIMYYIAANILEWNKKFVDVGQQSKKIINRWFLWYEYGWYTYETLEWAKYKTKKLLTEGIETKYSNYEYTVEKTGINQWWEHYAEIKFKKNDDAKTLQSNIKEAKESQEDFFMYREQWGLISTLREWVSSFDVAKIYSEGIVRDMLFDEEITSEYLWSVISLTYDNVWAERRILKELWEDTAQAKKYYEALEFARSKNWLAVRNLQKFYTDGWIDLLKKIDGKTFHETLANVSAKITNQWAVEFAWQDLIKYMNISDKETYNKIFAWYVDFFIDNYDTKVASNVEWLFMSLWIKWNTFWEKYVWFTNMVEKRISDAWELWWLEKEIALDSAKDIVSRLFVWAQWYVSMLNDIAKTWSFEMNKLVDEIWYGILLKNNSYSDSSYYDNIYNSIAKWFNEKNVDALKADQYWSLIDKKVLDLWTKEFEWYKQEKDFFNFLSARSTEYIQLSLKESGISKINMDFDTFSSFINKITFGKWKYQTVLDNEFMQKWIHEFVDWWLLKDATTRTEIIWVYKQALIDNKQKILSIISEKEYTDMNSYLDDMNKNGLSNDETKFFLEENANKMNTYGKWLSIDGFFRDTLNKDQITEIRTNKKDALSLWLYRDKKTQAIIERVEKMDNPTVEEAILSTNYYIQDHINLVDEIKTFGIDDVSQKIVKNDLYSLFFNIENQWAKLTTKQIDEYRKTKYVLDFKNRTNNEKHGWLSNIIGALTNPITVAEADRELWKVMDLAMKDMNKTMFVWEWSIWKFLSSVWQEGKYVSKSTFMQILQNELENHIRKWGLTYEKFTDDVANVYANKVNYKLLPSYRWSNMAWYREAVNAYAEILIRNKNKWWYYKIELVKWTEKLNKPEVAKNELKDLLHDIWKANWWKLFSWIRDKSKEADMMLGLWGNWLGMAYEDIKKLKDKSAIYHPKMFNNFLFKSFASTDSCFNALDTIMKWLRYTEKAAANAMYFSFYNILWAWWSAMTQQQLSNAIHLFGKRMAEIGTENMDYIDEVMDMVENMLPSDLAKLDIFKNRPEMADIIQSWKSKGKITQIFDQLLNMSSSLTWADKSIERSVKKYSLASSFIERWYKWDSAMEFVDKINKIIEDYIGKWYNEYIDIQTLMKYSDETSMKIVQNKLSNLVDEWTIALWDTKKVYDEIDAYRQSMSEFRDIVSNARIKTSTFFQMNKTPEMVQNFIGWASGVANMRFLNRASRKAGDYWFKLVNAIKSGDNNALFNIITQIVWEWLYAGKIYTYFNNASNGGVDARQFMWSMYLPYVVLNMATLSAFDWLINLVDSSDYEKNVWLWKVALDKLYELSFWFKQQFQWRFASAPLYWMWQTYKQLNWLKVLEESEDWESIYKYKLWANVLKVINEMAWDILQWRVGKFNTQTSDWLYSNFLSNDNQNYMLNFLVNKVVTNDLIWEKELGSAFYNIMGGDKNTSAWTISLEILWFKRNQRFAARELWKFYQQEWLNQLNGWPYVLNILDKINVQNDLWSIQKQMLAEWKDVSVVEKLINDNMNSVRENEWLWDGEWMKLADFWYKPFQIMVSAALMNSSEWDKALVDAWQWVTTKEKEDFAKNIVWLNQKVQEEIEAMPESLVKAAAYDPTLITKKLTSWKWRFWEQQLIWATLNAMSNINKNLIKEWYKLQNGKQRYKENSKQPWFKEQVEQENAKYQRQLVSDNYNTVLLWNQTMAITLADLYINTSKNSPLKWQLTNYSILWTTFNLWLIEKNIASQWLASMWTNNAFAQQNSRAWNYVNWLSPEEKEKKLKDMFAWKIWMFDYADKYMDPLTAKNAKVGMWVSDINNLIDIAKDPDLLEKVAPSIKDYLDRVTVSQPLTDEKVMEQIRDEIFKTPGKWKKKKWHLSANKIKDDLNKLSDFKWEFYRDVLKQEPLNDVQYKLSWSTIIPLKISSMEAKKIKAQYQFIKPKAPESEKTPDIVVHMVKTSKTSWKYTDKSIKGSNVYTIKTTKWRKK